MFLKQSRWVGRPSRYYTLVIMAIFLTVIVIKIIIIIISPFKGVKITLFYASASSTAHRNAFGLERNFAKVYFLLF